MSDRCPLGYLFFLVLDGGQDKWPGQLPPGEDNQSVRQDKPGQLAPGGKLSRGQDKLGHRHY